MVLSGEKRFKFSAKMQIYALFAKAIIQEYISKYEKSVYLDSTVFSFFFDERAESFQRRKITIEWWQTQKKYFDCYTSAFVIAELRNPVYPLWKKVSDLAERVPIVEDSLEIRGIIKDLSESQTHACRFGG